MTELKRRIAELEDEMRDKRKVESDAGVVRVRLEELQRTVTSDEDPMACAVCANTTRAVLPCGHRLCADGVHTLSMEQLQKDGRSVACPCCRKLYAFDFDPNMVELVDARAVRATDPKLPYVATTALAAWKRDAPTLRRYMRSYLVRMDQWLRSPGTVDEHEDTVRMNRHIFKRAWSAPPSPTHT